VPRARSVAAKRRPVKLSTVDGALRALELLAELGRIGVRDVAAELGCSRSSAYRVIRTLHDRNWIGETSSGTYELGSFALVLGTRALQRLSLRDIALPPMRRLVERSQETVTVSVLVGTERVCVDQLESPRQVRMTVQVGRPYPLYAGASGKAILTAMDPESLAQYLAKVRLTRLTPKSPASRDALLSSLEQARTQGYVVTVAERDPEAYSVAAPLLGRTGVLGSIAICGPASRFAPAESARFGVLVRDAAEEISAALGAGSDDGAAAPAATATSSRPRTARRATAR
jgi:DNA-binding IclR family transcriptional regulator